MCDVICFILDPTNSLFKNTAEYLVNITFAMKSMPNIFRHESYPFKRQTYLYSGKENTNFLWVSELCKFIF